MPSLFRFHEPSGRRSLPTIPLCGRCGLLKGCQSPQMGLDGAGHKKIFICGEAPGRTEDRDGRPFVGLSGARLDKVLRRYGVERSDCWVDNAIVCHKKGDEKPSDKEIQFCRPNVIHHILRCQPNVLILLGGIAVKSVIGHFWQDKDVGGIMRWAGFQIPSQAPNTWICPTFHPAFCEREEREKRFLASAFFEQHIENAINLAASPPWEEPPDYKKFVQVVMDTNEAARRIRNFIYRGELVAFDYETNMLKPESPDREIVCCAVSSGEHTIAYPWLGEAIPATKELLRSNLPKVAQNLQFEHRWTAQFFGVDVRRWVWDTMNTAHVLDARRNITGLKFQAYVQLGVGAYDEHVSPYLESKDGRTMSPNRIRELPLRRVLEYCGLDALIEYMVYEQQQKELLQRVEATDVSRS